MNFITIYICIYNCIKNCECKMWLILRKKKTDLHQPNTSTYIHESILNE